jgi:hypothetical protein
LGRCARGIGRRWHMAAIMVNEAEAERNM